jgi:SAM-dependent methyltransferase
MNLVHAEAVGMVIAASSDWTEDDQLWSDFGVAAFGHERWATAAAESEELAVLLDASPPADVLDLCCGPGRYLVPLAQLGYHVTGVDRTSEYLTAAASRAQALGLKVELVRADMRQFHRDSTFDAAINVGLSFGYFRDESENRSVLSNVHRSLKRGGRLVLDVATLEWPRSLGPWYCVERPGFSAFVQQRFDAQTNWLEASWMVRRGGGPPRQFTFAQRLYTAQTLRAALTACGFDTVMMARDLAGNGVTPDARKIIAVAIKL